MGKISKMINKIRGKDFEYKQVILVREDLNLPKGKMAAQVAHASVAALIETEQEGKKDIVDRWKNEGMKKVVLKVKNAQELKEFKDIAKQNGLVAVIITDAGLTVVKPGTTTCLGIGPDEEGKIDEVTGKLSTY
jgi:PTH2 family peptidyl-tRNA hydrolase